MPEVHEFYKEAHDLADKYLYSPSTAATQAAFRAEAQQLVTSWYDRGGAFLDHEGKIIETSEEAELIVNRTDYTLNVSLIRRPSGRA